MGPTCNTGAKRTRKPFQLGQVCSSFAQVQSLKLFRTLRYPGLDSGEYVNVSRSAGTMSCTDSVLSGQDCPLRCQNLRTARTRLRGCQRIGQ